MVSTNRQEYLFWNMVSFSNFVMSCHVKCNYSLLSTSINTWQMSKCYDIINEWTILPKFFLETARENNEAAYDFSLRPELIYGSTKLIQFSDFLSFSSILEGNSYYQHLTFDSINLDHFFVMKTKVLFFIFNTDT